MRTYELLMITRGSLDETAMNSTVQRFATLIAEQGGNVQRVEHWGKRQFAYEIDHMTEGYYTVIDLESSGQGLVELERQLRLADDVVRHKVVRPAARTKNTS